MEDEKIMTPTNPTDPIVVFDPDNKSPHIVVQYDNTESSDDSHYDKTDLGSQTKYDAIAVPLVQVNETKIADANIKTVEILISDFFPKLNLVIYDENDFLQKINYPGIDSTVSVIMTAPIEGVSKKIALSFYITKAISNPDGTITIEGEFNVVGLKQEKNCQIGTKKLSTYDFLSMVAKDLQLGFATTEKCKEIDDSRWRQIYSMTYKDFIEYQISFAGIDKSSIFDAWIDQFGYIVMVNLNYVMTEQLNPNQLSMKIVKGAGFTDKDEMVEKQQYEETVRVISNSKDSGVVSNSLFGRWSTEVDNKKIEDSGTVNKYFYMTGLGDTNTISTFESEDIEYSTDGINNKDAYAFNKCQFIGFEMDEDSNPILVQSKNVNNFKAMMNYKQIYLEMIMPNYYLQRGMLVNVEFEDYDVETKNITIYNSGAALATGNEEDPFNKASSGNQIDNETAVEEIMNTHLGVMNPSLSGMYYINSMSFRYDKDSGEITQCMHLVKRGIRSNLVNKHSSFIINHE